MRKSINLMFSLLLVAGATIVPLSAVGHEWSDYCTTGPGLQYVYENASPSSGQQDFACNDDNEWGDSTGAIRGFHDKLSAYHQTDKPGSPDNCVLFYFDPFWAGAWDLKHKTSAHFPENYVGDANNDRVDSHEQYGSNTCP